MTEHHTTPSSSVRVFGVQVSKHSVKVFCGFAGIFLMSFDALASCSGIAHAAQVVEAASTNGGKLGAVLAALVFWFEHTDS
jgi:hypothetical protein